jgi:hypothetical protein
MALAELVSYVAGGDGLLHSPKPGAPYVVPPWNGQLPEGFDPRTYDWNANTGVTNPAASRTAGPTAISASNATVTLRNFTAKVDVQNSATGVVISESLMRAKIYQYELEGGQMTVERCTWEYTENDPSFAQGTAVGLNGGTVRRCRITAGDDGVTPYGGRNYMPSKSQVEYNWFKGVGYVLWEPWTDPADPDVLPPAPPLDYTVDASTNIVTTVQDHGFAAGNRVMFMSGAPFPAPVRFREMFYVHSVLSAKTFKVQPGLKGGSTLPIGQAGAETDFTSSGAGILYLGYIDGLHSDAIQFWQDGFCRIFRNRIEGFANAGIIIKSDKYPSRDANGVFISNDPPPGIPADPTTLSPIEQIVIEENWFRKVGFMDGYQIQVRSGDASSNAWKQRPRYITIRNNWFDRTYANNMNGGTNVGDEATYVRTEAIRDAAVAAQIATPSLLTTREQSVASGGAGLRPGSGDARCWIVFHDNRYDDTGEEVPPPLGVGWYTP